MPARSKIETAIWPGSGTAALVTSRTWKALIKGRPSIPFRLIFRKVSNALNVPMTYWPVPPEALLVLASSVTVVGEGRLDAIDSVLASQGALLESLVYHWKR